jgi:hypothetical protein
MTSSPIEPQRAERAPETKVSRIENRFVLLLLKLKAKPIELPVH